VREKQVELGTRGRKTGSGEKKAWKNGEREKKEKGGKNGGGVLAKKYKRRD
jgi:hypothetical protein